MAVVWRKREYAALVCPRGTVILEQEGVRACHLPTRVREDVLWVAEHPSHVEMRHRVLPVRTAVVVGVEYDFVANERRVLNEERPANIRQF